MQKILGAFLGVMISFVQIPSFAQEILEITHETFIQKQELKNRE